MSRIKSFVLAGIIGGLVLVGCGSSGSEPNIEPAADHDGQIARLQQQKQRLERKVKLQEKRDRARNHSAAGETAKNPDLDRMLNALPGSAGLVAGPTGSRGPSVSGGSFTNGDAWSTIKVPIAARVLRDYGGPNGISAAQSSNIANAITLSDNEAAAALFRDLESRHGGLSGASQAVGEMLQETGDGETVISTQGRDSFSTYGQTDWSLANQYRYMAALAGGCTGDSAGGALLLQQMASVGGSDSFGLGATGLPARWKGGWGPGTDGKYLVRQMGTVDAGGKEVVVAMAAIPDDGSFESGQAMLNEMASWVTSSLPGQIPASSGC